LAGVSLKEDFTKGLRGLPRYMLEHKFQTLFFALLLALALALVFAPLGVPGHDFDLGDFGVVGGNEHARQFTSMDNPVARFFYQAGDLGCHQRDTRSFFLGGNQMPFCARCTAIFVGMPLGMLVFFVVRREINPIALLLGFAPLALDGGLQLIGVYESTNLFRLVTGTTAGLTAGYAFAYIIGEFGFIIASRKRRSQ
jgi:uncharacterized membrane protein